MLDMITALLALATLVLLAWNLRLRRRPSLVGPAVLPAASSRPCPPLTPLFYTALDALDAGLLVIDTDRRLRYLNSVAEEILQTTRQRALDRALIVLIRDYQVDTLVGEVLRDGETREMVIQPPMEGRTLRVRATPMVLDDVPVVVIMLRDVTQIGMLERARRDMVANVSHELRTPLASVKLLVETLQSNPPPAIASRMLDQMAHEVDAITQLVDELHELSQIESGRVALQLTPTQLAPVITRALERIRPQAERKMIRCTTRLPETLPLILIDDGRIGQVLLNLLHNAIKFSPNEGEIIIAAQPISVDPQGHLITGYPSPAVTLPPGHGSGDWIMITIQDSGIGIPGQDLPRIFERFYKVDRARTRNSGGTGLGLAIAKHLVEGHGGRIWATSREGHGSTFFLTLPLADT
ncbi:MAG TPA: ATP-binding protein [Roseiflexaceae bacterium]|nr:ATP-binding protein [Roseiflexaceae bacterium]